MLRRREFPYQTLSRGGTAMTVVVLLATLARADPAPLPPPTDAAVTSPGDLRPPKITILRAASGIARGFIFVAPKTAPAPGLQQGPEIIDDQGRSVWFQPVTNGDQAADFRVQSYRGDPVLTYWEGQSHTGPGHGEGVGIIVDRTYHVIATLKAGNGFAADTHEFRLTSRGTALITVYNRIPYDLSPVGGPADGAIFDGIAQEVDVGTGRVIFEWHSIDHVGLDESHAPVPTLAGATYDYFHINAVSLDHDGNLLVNARNTWATYKVDRRSGHVIWRLGGKKTDFALGTDVEFAWQHDPEAVDRHTVRTFDNEASPVVRPASRVIWVRRDPFNQTATLVRAFAHPDGLSTGSQGNSQALDNGDTFVGWGQVGRFSEFDQVGNLVFDASVPTGFDTYRAYRHTWHGHPSTPPTVTAKRNSDGTTTVHAIWNGATEVVRWTVVGGEHPRALWPLGSAAWNGLDTTIAVVSDARHVAVVAQDEDGRLIGRSETISVAD